MQLAFPPGTTVNNQLSRRNYESGLACTHATGGVLDLGLQRTTLLSTSKMMSPRRTSLDSGTSGDTRRTCNEEYSMTYSRVTTVITSSWLHILARSCLHLRRRGGERSRLRRERSILYWYVVSSSQPEDSIEQECPMQDDSTTQDYR